MQERRREFARKCVAAEGTEGKTGIVRLPVVHTAKMALIGESQHAFVEFERNVHMHAIGRLIGAAKKFAGASKPDQMAIEAEMHLDQAAVEQEQEILALA